MPETATSLHTQKVIAVEKEVLFHVKTESTRFCPEGTEDKGGGCF
jgi:hypothetical protein